MTALIFRIVRWQLDGDLRFDSHELQGLLKIKSLFKKELS